MNMKKYIITYITLHIMTHCCPITAAFGESPLVKTVKDCDKTAELIARTLPQWVAPGHQLATLRELAKLMQHGRAAIKDPFSFQPANARFNSGNDDLDDHYELLRDSVNTIAPLRRESSARVRSQDRIILNETMADGMHNQQPLRPWKSLTSIYHGQLVDEDDVRQQLGDFQLANVHN